MSKKTRINPSSFLQNFFFLLRKHFNVFFGLTLFVSVAIFYWKALFSYFQGDEWYFFRILLPLTEHWYGPFIILRDSIIGSSYLSSGAHATPISFLLYYFSMFLFKDGYAWYVFSSIIIHSLNSLLVFFFVSQLLGRRIYGIVAGIFFAFSVIHFQAISWVITYVWTSLSVTFFLLTLIFLLKALGSPKKMRDLFFSCGFLLAAVLTKESVVIIIPIIIILVLLKADKKYYKHFFVPYGALFFSYLAIRFLLPILFPTSKASAANIAESIFRLFTFPLKMLSEVFISSQIATAVITSFLPLAYPEMEKLRRSKDALYGIFLETMGTDIIIYSVALAILCIIGITFFLLFRKDRVKADAILIAFLIITLTAIPLVAISSYAPWWGYSTFFDSRHIYLASVGGAILFSMVILFLADILSRSVKGRVSIHLFLIFLLILWIIPQYISLQEILKKEQNEAVMRKVIIDKILERLPAESREKVVYVESNGNYYGFSTNPPFQTNLGEVLMVMQFLDKKIPSGFLTSAFLSNDLQAQGYLKKDGAGFGYYQKKNVLAADVLKQNIQPSDVYSFSWDAKTQSLADITDSVQKELSERRERELTTQKMISYKDEVGNFSFLYDPSSQVVQLPLEKGMQSRLLIDAGDTKAEITKYEKPKEIVFHEYVIGLTNAEGDLVGNNFEVINLYRKGGGFYTAVKVKTNGSSQYLIPSYNGESYFDVRFPEQPSSSDIANYGNILLYSLDFE